MSIKARLALLAGTLVLLLVLFPVVPVEGAGKAAPGPAASADASGTWIPRAPGAGWSASLARLGGATFLVLALAGVSVFCLSRLQRFRARPGGRRVLDLVETLPLGARRRVHLARVGEKLILLAETDRDVSLLLELDREEPLPEPLPAVQADGPSAPFRRLLRTRAAEGGGS